MTIRVSNLPILVLRNVLAEKILSVHFAEQLNMSHQKFWTFKWKDTMNVAICGLSAS